MPYWGAGVYCALKFHGGLDDFGLANQLHELGDAALLDELGASVFGGEQTRCSPGGYPRTVVMSYRHATLLDLRQQSEHCQLAI